MNDGHRTAFNEAVAAAGAEEARQPPAQRDLFAGEGYQVALPKDELGQAIESASAEEVLEEVRFQEALEQQRRREERELLTGEGSARRGPGRPPGARNKRTDEAARFYTRMHGHPLKQAVKVAAIPILAPGVLEALARRLGSSRLDAARWWNSVLGTALPYTAQKLAQLEVKLPGAPDGDEPVPWALTDDGDLIDITATPAETDEERWIDAVPELERQE